MSGFKNWLRTGVLAGVVSVGALATATSASAYIVCNRWHQCWHAHNQYTYPATIGINVYPDTWRWSGTGWRWARDRDDRGYWYKGRWRRF